MKNNLQVSLSLTLEEYEMFKRKAQELNSSARQLMTDTLRSWITANPPANPSSENTSGS